MYNEQEEIKRKFDNLNTANQPEACGQAQGGMVGGYATINQDYRPPTLRDRLKRTIDDAGRQQQRARGANELFDLLNKNPEVARILELIEDVGL